MTRDDPAEEMLTVEQAAEAAYVSPKTVQSWVHRGLLEPVGRDQDGRNLFRALDVMLAERRTRRPSRLRALLAAAARTFSNTGDTGSDD